MANWFDIANINELDTPALVVYPDRVKQNIATLVAAIDDVDRLRPHVKTHKCKEATQLCMDAGIRKFKCATIAEAEMLALCKAPDVLLAYQPIGPKIKRLVALIKQYPDTQFSCLVDNYEAATTIDKIALAEQVTLNVYIDLNVGMNRSGIAPQKAFVLYERCELLQAVKVIGLHAYDGHIHNEDLDIRKQQCNAAFKLVEELIAELHQSGIDPVVIAGGSPTFPIHAKRKGVECSPGTFIYWDSGYGKELGEQTFLPTALVVARIVSLPDDTKICVDLGHKSVASENVLDKRVTFLNSPQLQPVSHSEEHLVLEAGANHNCKVGDVLYGVPHHICPTVALYERAITIQNNKTSGEWLTIARDRKINI
ncbi:D-TA family PLP-dependent enzyme [Mucilaginibacter sp. dw_454]|uniref:D-TA family PLP-dependent enzyme n=1 Tax=Mucilaginibacter sp. dw_454 TaxID=2720079 RepID=UPI001BD41BF2|nr:D-TA family PLP-dependent enzyme [Mucilaginibacter sp. dw_454]